MRWKLFLLPLFLASAAFAGGTVEHRAGSGGGTVKFSAGSGGGTVKYSLGLTEPINFAFISASSNTLGMSWAAHDLTPAATNYTVQVATSADFSGTVTSSSTANTTSTTTATLSVNKLYYGRVRGTAAIFDPSPWSGVRSTATLAVVPVTVISTWTGVTSSSLTVNWGASDNPAGTTYVCQISTVSGFGGGTTLSSTTLNTTAGFTALNAGTTYYGQVKAVNVLNMSTAFLNLGSTVTATSLAPVFGSTSTSGLVGTSSPIVWSHTVPSGSNRCLVVVFNATSGGTAQTITGVTFNTSESFTQAVQDSGGPGESVSIWVLINPTVTTANISVSYTGTPGAADSMIGGAINVTSCNQTSPIGNTTSAHPLGTNPSTNLTISQSNSYIVDSVQPDANTTPTPTSPQVAQWSGAMPLQFAAFGVSIKGPLATGTQSMGWNDGTNDAMHALAEIKGP